MRGNYDRLLKWPLEAEMKLVLLNQQQHGHDHELNIIGLNYGTPLRDGTASVECGKGIITASLDPYLHNGDLHIRIVRIKF